ncbi:uncharacterized protein LOC118437502 [Folsomia candida]|uniref:uncharacterized protein LOC118437502 n=1 Tax=Folsomia candida TaxID=158441 RepID=UPI0016054E5B|nr:uncharacterized protein LOC118437502 [Folsomia candida]
MGKTVDLSLTDCKVKNWILPAFSTTTENDVISCGVIFMATMKKYFDYECSFTLCGIPEVVLEGSVADWVEIDKRIDKLREYEGLETWWTMLKEITQQFLAAKEGKVDTSWWSKICDVEYYEGHMSGDPNKSWITGWITTFGYFDVEGNVNSTSRTKLSWALDVSEARPRSTIHKGLEMKDIPLSYVHVEVVLEE